MALQLDREIVVALVLVFGMCILPATCRTIPDAAMAERHEQWIDQHGRVYKDDSEKAMRFKIFKQNVEFIESFNSGGGRPYKTGHQPQCLQPLTGERKELLQESRIRGNVNWWIDTSGEDQGCNGGLMDDAFKFIVHNDGLTTESNYPYQGTDDTCNSQKEASSAAKITGYEDVPADDESALLKAVANQPVSVAIDASGMAFQFYMGGVFTGDCGLNWTMVLLLLVMGKLMMVPSIGW
ncbi:UNVERIFIED_CONTAM: Senescence-specific cysteine protease SAG39 [Sesamum radiatum]|uniref:Senescence-specific cysteine protease SAG39 n=1 Tax=Sesamum radiatum TaxID=300843 RepID=A0AAW2KIA5_SESRA